jgi:RND superfamily putative drug exporter
VGGSTAIDLDIREASQRDNRVIIPTVLVLIFLVLCLLLRALVAPLLLIGTVVLSYLGTLGACAVLFNHVFDYPGAESAFPLFAFVFLVALGVDYNIFLMTRVGEEAQRLGTRTGMLRGLTVTGGVITSAGVVLAATFATLLFTGLVFAAEMGIAVAFGVLLDTIVVRSLLVPALVLKAGDRVWWPSRTGRSVVEPEGAGEADLAEVPVG